jgi:hypothetical protein
MIMVDEDIAFRAPPRRYWGLKSCIPAMLVFWDATSLPFHANCFEERSIKYDIRSKGMNREWNGDVQVFSIRRR